MKETIKEMPCRKVLEEFLQGSHRPVTVIFNLETGKFEDRDGGKLKVCEGCKEPECKRP